MARTGPSTIAERSPLYVLLAEGRTFARWRLHDDPDAAKAVPALLELRAEGGTDYVLHLIWFAPGTALKGVAVSFATNRPSGFCDDDMAILVEVLPTLGLAMCKVSLSRTLHETLADVSWSWSARLPCAGLNESSRSGRRSGHRTSRWRTANRGLRKRPSRFISGCSSDPDRIGLSWSPLFESGPSGRFSVLRCGPIKLASQNSIAISDFSGFPFFRFRPVTQRDLQ